MNHLDINQIKEIIPHRHPFLLLDYIEDYVPGEYAVGYKCVSYREEFFAGQFSGRTGDAGSTDRGSAGTGRCGCNLKSGRKQRKDCIFRRN